MKWFLWGWIATLGSISCVWGMTLLIKDKREEKPSFCRRDIYNACTYLFICKCVIENRLYVYKHNYLFLGKYIYGQIVDSSYAYIFNINAWYPSHMIA